MTQETMNKETMNTDKAKRVFPYFDGERDIWGDPGRIQRELHMAIGDVNACLAAAYPEQPEAMTAEGKEQQKTALAPLLTPIKG
jgi:hypothetical protein